jgi:hypothetical protein
MHHINFGPKFSNMAILEKISEICQNCIFNAIK